jgi:hypothetical protein
MHREPDRLADVKQAAAVSIATPITEECRYNGQAQTMTECILELEWSI